MKVEEVSSGWIWSRPRRRSLFILCDNNKNVFAKLQMSHINS